MSKIVDKFVISDIPPKLTNVGWIKPIEGTDTCNLLFYNNGKWSSGDGSSEEITVIKEQIKVDYIKTDSGELESGNYYIITPTSDIVITLNNDSSTEAKEFLGEIVFGNTLYNVTFPDNILWDEEPSFAINSRYAFSIINGLGVIREFKTA